MRKILLLFVCIFLIVPLFATTIVIYITPQFVLMAADSKGIYTNAKTFKAEVHTVTKIFKTGPYYFGLAGITSSSFHPLNVSQLVSDALKQNNNIEAAIEQIKIKVGDAIKSYLLYNRQYHPALFRHDLQNGIYITSIGIIGIKNHQPYAHILGFTVTDSKNILLKVEEDHCPSSLSTSSVFYLGKTDAIKKYMDTLQIIHLPPDAFVAKLMSLQMKKTPQYVGGPIDMLQITPNKVIWLRRKQTTPIELK